MLYVNNSDYKTVMQLDQLDIISQADHSSILQAEISAKEEMAGYLSARYDTSKIFIEVPDHDLNASYNEGQAVSFEYAPGKWAVYVALANTTNPPTNTADWVQRDDRSAIIKTFLADIAVYTLFCSANPNNIPQLRGVRYEKVIEWCKGVQKMQINPDLPLLQANEFLQQVRFGSNEKRENHF